MITIWIYVTCGQKKINFLVSDDRRIGWRRIAGKRIKGRRISGRSIVVRRSSLMDLVVDDSKRICIR